MTDEEQVLFWSHAFAKTSIVAWWLWMLSKCYAHNSELSEKVLAVMFLACLVVVIAGMSVAYVGGWIP